MLYTRKEVTFILFRRILSVTAAALLLASTAWAEDRAENGTENVQVVVNGQELSPAGYGEDGVTFVPLTPFLDALGGWETSWDGGTRTAWAQTSIFSLSVPVEQDYVTADGWLYGLNSTSRITDERTYVPLRSMANLLGAEVSFEDWDKPVLVTAAPSVSYTEEDLYWLSRIISAESQGESLYGQIAVGNVVLNRVASPDFPNTIKDVVFDRKDAVQFEPVSVGSIYWEPAEQSVLAARLVLAGANTAGDCLYFFNPSLSKGTWIRANRAYHTTIGCHEFYK